MQGGFTRTRFFILAIVFMIAAPGIISHVFAAAPLALDDIKKVLPNVATYSHELKPLEYYRVQDDAGKVVGLAFITSSIPPAVRGHTDEIEVLVGMDVKGTVTGMYVLSHKEDADYFGKIVSSHFLKAFIGRSTDKGFADIDAVTGATVSSEAIKHDVETAAFEITKKLIDSGALTKRESGFPRPFDVAISATLLALIGMSVVAVNMPRRRWMRYVLWALSFGVVGIWLNTPITIGAFVDLRNGALPHLTLAILLIYAVVASLVKGNLYCAYLCPFGALQEGASRIGVPKCVPADAAEKNASWLRWIMLLASVFAIADGVNVFRSVEPFARCFARVYDPVVLAQAGVVVIAALFLRRPWCRYFCPTGAVLDLMAQCGVKMRCAVKNKIAKKKEEEISKLQKSNYKQTTKSK